MQPYLFAQGYDVALVSLVAIVPQPRDGYVRPVVRNAAISGAVHEQGLWTPLSYTTLSIAQYQALLTQFDLVDQLTAEGTFYLLSRALVWTRYNGLIVAPEMGVDLTRNTWLKDVVYRVINLVEPA